MKNEEFNPFVGDKLFSSAYPFLIPPRPSIIHDSIIKRVKEIAEYDFYKPMPTKDNNDLRDYTYKGYGIVKFSETHYGILGLCQKSPPYLCFKESLDECVLYIDYHITEKFRSISIL